MCELGQNAKNSGLANLVGTCAMSGPPSRGATSPEATPQATAPRLVGQPPGPSFMMYPIRSSTLCSKSRMMFLTTSPTEITPTTLPELSTGK